ncbi:MAG: hypothetical protein RI972_1027 [Pseudomonadota bacterium]
MPQGLIVAAVGRHFTLETEDGQRLQAHARGKRSEAVVGDRVQWNTTQTGGEIQAVIESLQPRRNLMHRQDLMRTKSFAANLDQVLMLVASQPLFSESQLTRAMVAAEAADIELVIVLNKTDLPDAGLARERLKPYVAMGTPMLELSIKHGHQDSLEQLAPRLQGRTTLLLGASGTGKSSLVNLLVPRAQSRVGELSQALQAGRHTTTHTLWHWLDDKRSGALIDSPGFQEFGLQQVPAADLARHMRDFRPLLGQCRFHNCQHRQEPDCAVTAAVADGRISAQRHRIYLEILQELQTQRW